MSETYVVIISDEGREMLSWYDTQSANYETIAKEIFSELGAWLVTTVGMFNAAATEKAGHHMPADIKVQVALLDQEKLAKMRQLSREAEVDNFLGTIEGIGGNRD